MGGSGSEGATADLLRTGQEALARGAWKEAHFAFEAVLAHTESPEALEGLGLAAVRLDDASLVFEARERAYRLYLERDDQLGAARAAIALAKDTFSFRGELAVANGWLLRAQRLLQGLESSPEAGWLAVCRAHIAIYQFDSIPALQFSAQALVVGREVGDSNLEVLALAYKGLALVFQGAINEGMSCLDEAAAAIVAGELTDIDAACTACCCLIYACEQVRDFRRAGQWCENLRALAARWSHNPMFSQCRAYYGTLLMSQGGWRKAETELVTAVRALELERPAQAADGLIRLAALYSQQGRYDEATALLEQAERSPFRALAGHLYLLVRAALALEQDEPERAIDLAERFLRVIPGGAQLTRAPALELLVHAWAARGELDRAEEGLAAFRAAVAPVTTKSMQGSLRFAEGLVAAAAGEHDSARRYFEDAMELWAISGAPVETAQARVALADALVELGRKQAAKREAAAALQVLQTVGAAGAARRAATLLQQLQNVPDASAEDDTSPMLTDRQVEVLRLVAQGLSNKEIAAQLVLSEHTIHRHVANILNRLGVSSRAAAVVYAIRHHLL